MRHPLPIAVLAAISALTIAGTCSAASARELPVQDLYCLQGSQSGYPGNCEFSTYQQCMATASGTNEGCGINPMRVFALQRQTQGRPR